MERIFQVGVVGCGMISGIYLQNIRTLFGNRLRVRGVFDRHPERAEKCAAEHSPCRRYECLEALLADPEVDIVLDLCPPAAHYSVNKQALEAGKHVYSEKPLAVEYTQGEKLLSIARSHGVSLCCAPDTPLGAMVQTARQIVDSGEIGAVIGATANLVKQGVESWHPNPNFLYQPGGGPLLDMGPYYLTVLLHLIGSVASVSAMDAVFFPTRHISSQPHFGEVIQVNVPTYVNALLRFESGALATFTATFDVWKSALPRLEIFGESGSLLLSDPNLFGGAVYLSRHGGEYVSVPLCFPNQENCRGLGLYDMAEALSAGTVPRTDGRYALHILEVIHAVSQSAACARHLSIQTRCGRPAPVIL